MSNRRLVESAQRTVSKLLGEECDDLGCPSDEVAEIEADAAAGGAPPSDEAGEDHEAEERTEVAIAKDLQILIPDLKGVNGPEGAEEAVERVNALAVELLAMHGVDVELDDVDAGEGGETEDVIDDADLEVKIDDKD
jgi:hypothetical protein